MTGIPLVSIRCLVYNHEPYLRQCLDGFVMQKTDFPFEAIVHDDASTDGSAAIIREYAEKYPDIIKPIYETENQYSKHDGSLVRIMNVAMHPDSKYVALCEGDDYWTDPNKLQMQVDVMESDQEVGLVYTCASQYDQQSQRIVLEQFGTAIDSFESELLNNKCITLTCCMRKDLLMSYREYYESHRLRERGWKMGDYPLLLYLCYHSKPYFIPKVTGVYRVLENSASHSSDMQKMVNFEMSVLDVRAYFAQYAHLEALMSKIVDNSVSSLQWLSLTRNQQPPYDLNQLETKYGVKLPFKRRVAHMVLKNKLLRNLTVSLLKWRKKI